MQQYKPRTQKGKVLHMPRGKYLSTAEVAERIGMSERTVNMWAQAWQDTGGQDGIPAFKLGRCWKYHSDEIDAWFARQRGSTAPAIPAIPVPIRKTGSSG